MNKNIILASLMATQLSPILTNTELKAMADEVIEAGQLQVGRTFISPELYRVYTWEKAEDEDGKIRLVEVKKPLRLQIEFLQAQVENYTLETDDMELMDLELRISFVDPVTHKVVQKSDFFYYAKQVTENKFSFFNCDSSAICRPNPRGKFYLIDTPLGPILKLKVGQYLGHVADDLPATVVFYEK